MSPRTPNAPDALVSSEQIPFKSVYTSETVCTNRRVPNKIRELVPDPTAGN